MWPVRRQTSDSQPSRGTERLTLSFSLRLSARPCRENPRDGQNKRFPWEGEAFEGQNDLGGMGVVQTALRSRLETSQGLPVV